MRRLVLVFVLVGLTAAGCGGSGGSASTAKYCDVARKGNQSFNLSSTTDLKTFFGQFDTFADQLLSAAPSDIKGDANIVIGAFRKVETSVRNAGYDPKKLDANSVAPITDPKVQAAGDRLNVYNAKNCGITSPTT